MPKNSWRGDHVSSADLAIDYARRLVNAEARGPGDVEPAMHRLEAKVGIGYWTIWGLWHKRRKVVDLDLFNRLRNAYLATCERQITKLQQELEIETVKGGHDDFQDLVAAAESLAAKIKAAKEKLAPVPSEGGRT